jgi:1-deoxy-D-xylulose 5-phosphate reductoisomerase
MLGSSVLNIHTELEVEKRANAELRLIVNTQGEQMEDLSHQVQETEAAMIRDQEEMKKQQAELNAKLNLLLGQQADQLNFKNENALNFKNGMNSKKCAEFLKWIQFQKWVQFRKWAEF